MGYHFKCTVEPVLGGHTSKYLHSKTDDCLMKDTTIVDRSYLNVLQLCYPSFDNHLLLKPKFRSGINDRLIQVRMYYAHVVLFKIFYERNCSATVQGDHNRFHGI
jgi:hypothetical protein